MLLKDKATAVCSVDMVARAALHRVLWNVDYTESIGESDEFSKV